MYVGGATGVGQWQNHSPNSMRGNMSPSPMSVHPSAAASAHNAPTVPSPLVHSMSAHTPGAATRPPSAKSTSASSSATTATTISTIGVVPTLRNPFEDDVLLRPAPPPPSRSGAALGGRIFDVIKTARLNVGYTPIEPPLRFRLPLAANTPAGDAFNFGYPLSAPAQLRRTPSDRLAKPLPQPALMQPMAAAAATAAMLPPMSTPTTSAQQPPHAPPPPTTTSKRAKKKKEPPPPPPPPSQPAPETMEPPMHSHAPPLNGAPPYMMMPPLDAAGASCFPHDLSMAPDPRHANSPSALPPHMRCKRRRQHEERSIETPLLARSTSADGYAQPPPPHLIAAAANYAQPRFIRPQDKYVVSAADCANCRSSITVGHFVCARDYQLAKYRRSG